MSGELFQTESVGFNNHPIAVNDHSTGSQSDPSRTHHGLGDDSTIQYTATKQYHQVHGVLLKGPTDLYDVIMVSQEKDNELNTLHCAD